MILEDLGYNPTFEQFRVVNQLTGFEIGRVISEHKERYVVKTVNADVDAEIVGNLRFTAKSREDFPAVGDWVALTVYEHNFAIIHKVFSRYSVIKRQAVGQVAEEQIIAANIDYAFLVQAADRDFNLNRLERYLILCNESKVSPIIVLTKTDLLQSQQVTELITSIQSRIHQVSVIAISNETHEGYTEIEKIIEKGKTYCMLGSSGVGKSTLINNLSQKSLMRTDSISQSNHKGRHVTTHRELIILENGGMFVDNPGMREVGITDASSGMEMTFDQIFDYAKHCKFKDCTHTSERGCSVLEALEKGEIDQASYHNYLKIEKEKAHFESSVAERRKKEKEFGKIVKDFKKKYAK
jgi:ribosome biogenesis GTPase / thiamine phosphate phosphatase